ncbi:MAG TPA: hypothetical protein VNL95_05345, partial [Dehalococcoidia bacterium]|nr:hypothetical protein [Dehalococcoidia bacterium]
MWTPAPAPLPRPAVCGAEQPVRGRPGGRRLRPYLLMALALAALLLPPRSLPAQERTAFIVNTAQDLADAVPDDGHCSTSRDPSEGLCSLRAAIMEAGANPEGSFEVVLAGGEEYALTINLADAGEDDDLGYVGDLDVVGDVLVRTEGSGPAVVRRGLPDPCQPDGVAAPHEFRVFHVGPGAIAAALELRNVWVRDGCAEGDGGGILAGSNASLSIVGGTVSDNRALGSGGGIRFAGSCPGCALTVQDTTVRGNAARLGGGIAADDKAVVLDSAVLDNEASSGGGGLLLAGSARLEGVVVQANRQVGADDPLGGGGLLCGGLVDAPCLQLSIVGGSFGGHGQGNSATGPGGGLRVMGGSLSMSGTVVAGNGSGQQGGGLALRDVGATLHDSYWSGNVAATQGGAIYAEGGQLHMARSTVVGSRAGTGGGLYLGGAARGTLVNSTLSGNEAEGQGGGMGLGARASLDLFFSTVTANRGTPGGGLRLDEPADAGVLRRLKATIVAANETTSGDGGSDCSGAFVSLGYNLLGDAGGCTFEPQTGDTVGQDPLLAGL